jgi:gag-polypeptide of LTR copia-type
METVLDENEIWNVVKGIEEEGEPVITSEASDDVLNKFAPKTKATLRKLQREFMSMKMEEDDNDVEKYTQKVAILKRKVEEQEEIISDNAHIGVLARLLKEYDTIITILDSVLNFKYLNEKPII